MQRHEWASEQGVGGGACLLQWHPIHATPPGAIHTNMPPQKVGAGATIRTLSMRQRFPSSDTVLVRLLALIYSKPT